MKIIGTTEVQNGAYFKEPAYIAIITQSEICKVANKARHDDGGPKPKVGDDYPIAEGYDFRNELDAAIRKMTEAYAAFAKVAPIAAQFAGIVQRKAESEGGAA